MSTLEPTTRHVPRALPSDPGYVITVVAWRDSIIEQLPDSHPTAANDTLVWWTPVLGPTATIMAHRLAGHVGLGCECRFTLAELARTFGLGNASGRVQAALLRLARFGLVNVTCSTVAVRTTLPPLTARQRAQLPGYLAEMYERRLAATKLHARSA